MNLREVISQYANQPITHQLIGGFLQDYNNPNDKIHALLAEGMLESVKKGLYVAGPAASTRRPGIFILANHILGPSYISLDTALSYYELIPERVYEHTSVTIKSSRKFKTPLGQFSYTHLSMPYYSFGIRQVKLEDGQYAMIATPEKAVFDKIVTTAGVVLRSVKNATGYLLDDLRMDEAILKDLDTQAMRSWLAYSPKKESLSMLIKAIESL